VHVAHPI
jgi:hypothetical protein